jgi:hypothetical protein
MDVGRPRFGARRPGWPVDARVANLDEAVRVALVVRNWASEIKHIHERSPRGIIGRPQASAINPRLERDYGMGTGAGPVARAVVYLPFRSRRGHDDQMGFRRVLRALPGREPAGGQAVLRAGAAARPGRRGLGALPAPEGGAAAGGRRAVRHTASGAAITPAEGRHVSVNTHLPGPPAARRVGRRRHGCAPSLGDTISRRSLTGPSPFMLRPTARRSGGASRRTSHLVG